jgi:transposase
MTIGKELETHYGTLLGISSPWKIEDVKINTDDKKVTIIVTWPKGEKVLCPTCGKYHSVYDHRAERSWRHLDTMQFATIIKCCVPRCGCPSGKVKTINVPWAEPERRFTILFEKFAIDVIQACKSIKAAQGLLGLSWDEVCLIMKKAVERGKKKQVIKEIKYAGIDEKSFKRGHKYISVLADIERGAVIDVVKDRTKEATKELWEKVPKQK